MVSQFFDQLLDQYVLDPTGVLPYAYWKALIRISPEESNYMFSENNLQWIYGAKGDCLEFAWQKMDYSDIPLNQLASNFDIMMINERMLNSINVPFRKLTPFFKLKHDLKQVKSVILPEGYQFCNAVFPDEIHIISEFISNCYEHIKPSEKTVFSWTKEFVFDPSLWIWLLDENSNKIALGIADFDSNVLEGALEWIQVHPDYRGLGAGQYIVEELLNRLKNKASFVTVSGEADNLTNPERLYRKCGFIGDSVWWVLERIK